MKTKNLILTMFVFLTTTVAFAQNNLQDVVYLKNGSIIRGTIIEQVPNVSLKIETADGNLFVYKIDEVERMTKEHVVTPTQNTTPSESETVRQKLQANRQMLNSSTEVQPTPQQKGTVPQPIEDEKRTQFGIKGGLNSASESTTNGQTTSRTGIHLGFFVETPISTKVGFQPELLYSMQGCGGISGDNNFDYINLPLMFKFYVWQQRLSIDAGLQFGYMISAKINSIDVYDVDGLNKFDASIGFGLSFKITDQFDATIRGTAGFTDIVKDSDHKNSVFQLGLGYRF